MKTIKQILFPILALVLFLQSDLFSQADQQAEMQAWMEYMTPGDIHKMLATSDGEWTGQVTMWMDPNAAPTVSAGTSSSKMIMGGRYQQSTFSGNMMGMPFEGISITGYDNAKKKFVSSWIDNMGTGIMTMDGTWDEGTKTINFSGQQIDPLTGKMCDIRETFTIVDANNQVMEMFMTKDDAKEIKTMEIKFTRK
ncbi:MAG: DUF1579 domain-containing protein [Bacteroidota bacterium]|nr:DUF1579 domain-containing protein [Bacteroidota bacterium]